MKRHMALYRRPRGQGLLEGSHEFPIQDRKQAFYRMLTVRSPICYWKNTNESLK
jgi:hypothetical protein